MKTIWNRGRGSDNSRAGRGRDGEGCRHRWASEVWRRDRGLGEVKKPQTQKGTEIYPQSLFYLIIWGGYSSHSTPNPWGICCPSVPRRPLPEACPEFRLPS